MQTMKDGQMTCDFTSFSMYNITVRSGKLRETAGRAVTNVVRTCGLTHLLVFDFMSNKTCLNHVRKMGGLKTVCNGTQFIVGKVSASREGGGAQT